MITVLWSVPAFLLQPRAGSQTLRRKSLVATSSPFQRVGGDKPPMDLSPLGMKYNCMRKGQWPGTLVPY